MKPEVPQYYVITSQGQSGPYDVATLREAIRSGEVAPADQVRTALGTPLGTVVKVLDVKSKIARSTMPTQRGRRPWMRGWVPVTMVMLILLGMALVIGQGGDGASPDLSMPPRSPVKPSPLAARPQQALTPVVPQSAHEVGIETSRVVGDGRAGLLASRQPGDWLVGEGGQVSIGAAGTWRLDFSAVNGWVGIGPAAGEWNAGESVGLVLDLHGGTASARLKLQVFEEDGETFFTMIGLPVVGAVTVPWSTLVRDTVQRQDAVNNGFQASRIRFVSLICTAAPTSVVLHDIRWAPAGSSMAPAVLDVPAAPSSSVSILGRHAAGDWSSGGGVALRVASDLQSWSFDFTDGGGGWVGVTPVVKSDVIRSGAGVSLDMTGGSADCRFLLQIIEPDGESYVSSFILRAGVIESGFKLPWSSFQRDRNQRPGVPNDGFQHAGIDYLSFTLLSGGAHGVVLRGMSVYP